MQGSIQVFLRLFLKMMALVVLMAGTACTRPSPEEKQAEARARQLIEQMKDPEAAQPAVDEEGATPSADQAQVEVEERCEQQWSPAAATLRKVLKNRNPKDFVVLKDQIPPKEEPVASCDSQDEVVQALDQNMQALRKSAASVFDFTTFLARLQYVTDGAAAEGLCDEGPALLKENPKDFLRALKAEKSKMSEVDCLVDSTTEFVDASASVRKQGLQKRLDSLKSVKDKNLQQIRNELMAIVQAAMD